MPEALLFVVVDDWRSLRVEDAKPFGERFDIII